MPEAQLQLDKIRLWKTCLQPKIEDLKPVRINKYKSNITRPFRRRFTERDLWHIVTMRYGVEIDVNCPARTAAYVAKQTGVPQSTVRTVCKRFIKEGCTIKLNRKLNECSPRRVKITSEIAHYLTLPSTL